MLAEREDDWQSRRYLLELILLDYEHQASGEVFCVRCMLPLHTSIVSKPTGHAPNCPVILVQKFLGLEVDEVRG